MYGYINHSDDIILILNSDHKYIPKKLDIESNEDFYGRLLREKEVLNARAIFELSTREKLFKYQLDLILNHIDSEITNLRLSSLNSIEDPRYKFVRLTAKDRKKMSQKKTRNLKMLFINKKIVAPRESVVERDPYNNIFNKPKTRNSHNSTILFRTAKSKNTKINNTICEFCEIETQIDIPSGRHVCLRCGHCFDVMVEDCVKYLENSPTGEKGYKYDRKKHSLGLIDNARGIEMSKIIHNIDEIIDSELKHSGLQYSDLTPALLRKILKKHKLGKYKKNIPYFLSKKNNFKLLSTTEEELKIVKAIINEVESIYNEYLKPDYKINFISHYFLLHEAYRLLGKDKEAARFPLLSGADKLRDLKNIWKSACDILNYEYLA